MNRKFALLAAAVAAALPSAALATVDGTIDGGDSYTFSLYQNQATGFGNNQSELDGAFLKYTPGGNLELGLTGNLETNNTLVIFIDSKTGGAVNAAVPGGFNNFSHSGAGAGIRTVGWDNATVAPAFNPDWSLEFNRTATGYHFDIIDLKEPAGSPNRNRYQGHTLNSGTGTTTTTNYVRDGAIPAGTIIHRLNDTNTAGVGGADGNTGAPIAPAVDHSGGNTATTGWEFNFDPTFLGYSEGTALRAMAFIAGGDSYLSNQFLPGIGAPTGNLAYNKFNAQIYGDASYLEAFVPTRTTGGLWDDDPANWTGDATPTVPNGAEHSAALSSPTAQTIDTGLGVALGYLKLDNGDATGGWTIDGTSPLSMDGGAGAAIILSTDGANVIQAPVNFPDDTRIRVNAGSSVEIKNGYAIASPNRVTKAGPGTLILDGLLENGAGAGASLAVDGGAVIIKTNMGAGSGGTSRPDVYVGGAGSVATVTFNVAQQLNAIAVNGQGTATLNGNVTLRNLYVNGGTSNGTGTILIDDGGAAGAQIKSDGGTGDGHVNNAVNIVASATNGITAEIHGGATAFLDGPLTMAAGKRITKTFTGWLALNGTQTHGADPQIAIDDGQVMLGSNFGNGLAIGDRPRIFVSQETAGALGKLRIDANQTLERIRVNTDGVVTISQNGNRLLESDTLFMMPTGKTDVKDNKMLLHGGDDTTLGTWNGTAYDGITGEIARGRGTGIFDGAGGIVTTMTPATNGSGYRSIGVASAGSVGITNFAGTATVPGDILVAYTFNGDANLSGNVDADDYFVIDSNYNKSATVHGWRNGDFTYDGVIDGDDFAAIDMGYGGQFASPPAGVAAVPEPAGLTLMTFGAAALMARRRRRA